MKIVEKEKLCRKLSHRLAKLLFSSIHPDALWVQKHLAACPGCRKKMRGFARVDLALALLKAQPHKVDLLKRANTQALGVLKHSLRYSKKARALKNKYPEPSLLSRLRKYRSSAVNVAACIAIMFLLKTGIFTSMDKFHDSSRTALKSYYARHVGQEMADKIFPA